MTKLIHLGLALSLLGAAAAAPAMAAEAPFDNAVRVAVGDLNFAKAADVAKFDARVQAAAKVLCETSHWSQVLKVRECYRDVAADAAAKLGEAQRQQMAATRAGVAQKTLGLG